LQALEQRAAAGLGDLMDLAAQVLTDACDLWQRLSLLQQRGHILAACSQDVRRVVVGAYAKGVGGLVSSSCKCRPQLLGMGRCLRGSEDDHGTARSAHPSLSYRLDWQREPSLQAQLKNGNNRGGQNKEIRQILSHTLAQLTGSIFNGQNPGWYSLQINSQ